MSRGRRRRRTDSIRARQFGEVERLADIVVGSDLEADHTVDRGIRAGQHHDARIVVLAQPAGEPKAVLAGQPDVEHHQIGRGLAQQTPQIDTVRGRPNTMPGQGQVFGEHRAKVRLVVDDDQLGHGIAIPSSAKVFGKQQKSHHWRQGATGGCPLPARPGRSRDTIETLGRPNEIGSKQRPSRLVAKTSVGLDSSIAPAEADRGRP